VINRRRTPLVVSGVADGIGLVLGLSGFFLAGGALVLMRLHERLWLNSLTTASTPPLGPVLAGLLLTVLYAVAVIGLLAYLFARQQHLTSIYNTDPEQVEAGLTEAFDRLGLQPVRSGALFYFRREDEPRPTAAGTVLELETFSALRHVTLRWDPADAALRGPVEAELTGSLAEAPAEEPGEVGFWLMAVGLFLFGLSMVGLGIGLAAFWTGGGA
jgi:hypothetical protein